MARTAVALGGTAIAVVDTATTIGRATAALRVLVVGELVHLHLLVAMPMAKRFPMAAMQWCRLPCAACMAADLMAAPAPSLIVCVSGTELDCVSGTELDCVCP